MGAPQRRGGGVWQWGSCDRNHGKVPIFVHFCHFFTESRNYFPPVPTGYKRGTGKA